MQMFWIAGGSSEITTLLSTGVQSIEFQLPTQSRQDSPSAFFGQQWIQFEGLKGPWGSIWFPSLEVRICLLSFCFTFCFHWQTGAKLCQREGTGVGGGEALATRKQDKARVAPFSVYIKKGLGEAGSTTVHLWSAGREMGPQLP